MSSSRLLFLGALCVLLAACSNPISRFNAYKINIQQGNVLTQEMVSQLRPGQTREQVRFILGTPMLMDIFHQERWDYVYSFRNGRTGAVETRRFSVYFDKNNRLVRVGGDVDLAADEDLTKPVAQTRVVDLGSLPEDGSAPAMPPPEGPGLWQRMLNSVGF